MQAVDTNVPALGLPMGTGEFTEQQIGLADKIPLVKPYFKKKHAQRKLDTKCLRALEDPILSTLLNSDALVSGDGVFVPRNPARPQRNICTVAVQKQSRILKCVWRRRRARTLLWPRASLRWEQKVTDIQRVSIDANERRLQSQERDEAAPSSDVFGGEVKWHLHHWDFAGCKLPRHQRGRDLSG